MFFLKNAIIKALMTVIILLMIAFIPQVYASNQINYTVVKPQITAYWDKWFYWHRWRQSQWWGGQFHTEQPQFINYNGPTYHFEAH